jgi:GNAT superfamily N-acetyltransferase
MAGQRWPAILPVRQVRIARPTDQLDAVVSFYRDGLGLPELERFAGHARYRGVLLGLPATDHHLEFTQHDDGSPGAAPSRDNLLVLSFDDRAQVEQVLTRLASLGHLPVEAENPYWTENGAITIEDPDRWRVVLMAQPLTDRSNLDTAIAMYDGDRSALRPLFELAEDSARELDSYLHLGRVLIATSGTEVVAHLQLLDTGEPGRAELKNMAVRDDLQGHGIGGELIRAALAQLASEGARVLRVATAAADIDNLRFYQRQGFRMTSIDADAFTEEAGYPASDLGGIPLRDRVWLELDWDQAATGPPG